MKKLAVLLLLIALAACSNNNERKKILPDYETLYHYRELKHPTNSQALYSINRIAPEIPGIINEVKQYLNKHEKTYILKMRLFINEDGRLNYVKFIEEPHFMEGNTDIEEDIIAIIDKHTFPKTILNGSFAKSAFDLKIKNGKEFDEDKYAVSDEKMPQIVGGLQALAKNIVYPEEAKKHGIEGRVFIKAFVDEKGNVVKAEVIKGIGFGCDTAAVNAVLRLHFIPGIQKGKPIKTQVAIPVAFKLK